jgi:hypothetical protein
MTGEVVGSNPHCGAPCTIHLDQSMEAEIDWKITWHVAYPVILQKGGWTLRAVGL